VSNFIFHPWKTLVVLVVPWKKGLVMTLRWIESDMPKHTCYRHGQQRTWETTMEEGDGKVLNFPAQMTHFAAASLFIEPY
jgi:hypothetical protein